MGQFITDGNMVDVANELKWHLSKSLAHSNQVTANCSSSAQPLNSHHIDLNKNGQNEAQLNLTVNKPKNTSNRSLVINNAPVENCN